MALARSQTGPRDHASLTYFTSFPFPAPRATLCVGCGWGEEKTRAHCIGSGWRGVCAVVLWDVGVERL